jgi:hypothetical protein
MYSRRPSAALCGLFCFLTAVLSAADLKGVLAQGASAEKTGDFGQACRIYLSALPEGAGDKNLTLALTRAARQLENQMNAQREADASRYVRDARMSADRRYAVQKEQRDRVAQAARLISKDELLQASDVLNRVLEEAPGLDEARDQMGRLDRRLAARLNRRFPSSQHQAVYEGIHFYNRGQWDGAARSLRLA